MAGDYVPSNDSEFLAWATAWHAYAAAHAAAIGLTPAEVATLADTLSNFQAGLNGHTAAQNAAEAAKQIRDTSRDELESWLRAASQRVQVCPTTTNADRSGLGITVHEVIPTAGAIPDTRPQASIDAGQRFRHEVRWRDETSGRRAKPAGTTGCEVWMKVGEAPTDPSECRLLGIESRSTFVADFNGEDGGKTAHYMLRWVGPKGQKGPWSETVAATIQN